MDVKIDSEAVQALVTKALFDELGQEQRDAVFRQALDQLMRPRKTTYGGVEPSPLQDAFDAALRGAVYAVARELVAEHPELRERIRAMVGDVIAQLLAADDGSQASGAVASAFTKAVSDWLAGRAYE